MTGDTELWDVLGDALDEAGLALHLRDHIDSAVCGLVRAERRDVVSCLAIVIQNPHHELGLEGGFVPRPLS